MGESDSGKEEDDISGGDPYKFFDKDMELEMGWAVNQIRRNSSQMRYKTSNKASIIYPHTTSNHKFDFKSKSNV